MSVTQNEIARITGLSRSTVSTILAGKFAQNYSKETRRLVLEIARRLDYRPNRQALTLKTGKSDIIGVVHTGSILPLTHQKIAETVKAITERGLEPLVYHNVWFENSKGIVDILLANKVHGVVLINSYYKKGRSKDLQRLLKTVRVVQCGGYKAPGIPLVGPDKVSDIRTCVQHLASRGHREIHMMSTGKNYPTVNPVDAFTSLFEEPPFRHIRHHFLDITGVPESHADPYATGAKAFDILEKIRKGPCAVICHDDNAAISLYLRCLSAGVRVPEDIAIVGSDNLVLGKRLPSPLTTAEQPVAAMSRRTVELLMQPEYDPDAMELIPSKLIVRDSCRAGG